MAHRTAIYIDISLSRGPFGELKNSNGKEQQRDRKFTAASSRGRPANLASWSYL